MWRRPADVLRVLAGGGGGSGAGTAHRGHVFAFEEHLFRLVNQLPDALGRPLLVVMQLGALAAVPAVARWRWPPAGRLARDLALSGALAWVLAKLVKGLVGGPGQSPCSTGSCALRHRSWLSLRSCRGGGRAGDRGRAVAAAPAAGGLGGGLAGGAGAGCTCPWTWSVGRRWAGRWPPPCIWPLAAPGGRPTASAIRQGLRAAGIDPHSLQPVGVDARGSVPFVVEVGDGERLFVKAVGREQRDADLLSKLWRWATFGEVEDETRSPAPSRRSSTRPPCRCWPPAPGSAPRRC